MDKKFRARRKARELAFQVLYSLDFSPAADMDALKHAFMFSPHNEDSGQDGEPREPSGMAWELTEGVWRNGRRLNGMLESLSHKWSVERMGKIELVLLRMALYEMLEKKTPAKVVINETLELAKQFGAGNAKSFINGILDAAVKSAVSLDIN